RPILPAPKCNAFIVLTFINVFTREGWGEERFPHNLPHSPRGLGLSTVIYFYYKKNPAHQTGLGILFSVFLV
ncbi:hypothetical protein, partial [Enterobacter hormaechei]